MKKYKYQPLTFVAPVRAICGNPKIIALMVLCTIIVTNTMAQERATKEHRHLIKQHCYADYKQMYKQPEGGALIYPYITPGSRQYARVLWDWDSWLSDVALRQILADTGTDADRREALTYEQGCVLNYLAYTSLEDGYMPMVVDAESDPAKMKPKDIYSTNITTCAPPTTPPTGRDRYGASPIIWCSGGWLTTASTRRRGNWRKRPSASLVKTSKRRAPSTNIMTLTQEHPSSTRDFRTGTTSC